MATIRRTFLINKVAKMPPLRKNTASNPASRGGDPPAAYAHGQWRSAINKTKGSSWNPKYHQE